MAASNVRSITAGPGELDICVFLFRRQWHRHSGLTFTFDGLGQLAACVESVAINWQQDDAVNLAGIVYLDDHHRRRHSFTATYNVRTRTGQATFEAKCRTCGADALSERGFDHECAAVEHEA
jgi:hypothetical protein